MSLRLRRGIESQRSGFTFDAGELIWVTNTEKLYIGDGTTAGGKSIIKEYAGPGLQYNATTDELELGVLNLTTDDIDEGSNYRYFTVQRSQDATGSLFTTGSHTGISFTYDDVLHKINATVTTNTEGVEDIVGSMVTFGNYFGFSLSYDDDNSRIVGSIDTDVIQDYASNLFVNGEHQGITYSYNDVTDTIDSTVIAMLDLADDLNPNLGGDLDLSAYDVIGSGNIDIIGYISNSVVTINENIISAPLGTNFVLTNALEISSSDAAPVTIVKNVSQSSFFDLSKFTFAGYGSNLSTPTNSSVGDYIGSLTGVVYNTTIDGVLPLAAINYQIDSNGVLNDDVANGKLEFVTIGGTVSPTFNYLTFDSKGQLAVNQETAQATVDINGALRLEPLTAEPDTVVNGMLAIADGTSWNPTSTGKQTLVARLGGTWVQVAVAP